jgi:hypothetical protein
LADYIPTEHIRRLIALISKFKIKREASDD